MALCNEGHQVNLQKKNPKIECRFDEQENVCYLDMTKVTDEMVRTLDQQELLKNNSLEQAKKSLQRMFESSPKMISSATLPPKQTASLALRYFIE